MKIRIAMAVLCISAAMLAGCADDPGGIENSAASESSVSETTAAITVIESSIAVESSQDDESSDTNNSAISPEEVSMPSDISKADSFKPILEIMIEQLEEEYENTPGILNEDEGIVLTDTDGFGTVFNFAYGDETYTAVYTEDNWKIIDSFRIASKADMLIICQALTDIYPIHGSDYESFREPEDLAYEWIQHNIAYRLLPEGDRWKENAKDVDLNPEDQNKNIFEMYKAKTGKDLI